MGNCPVCNGVDWNVRYQGSQIVGYTCSRCRYEYNVRQIPAYAASANSEAEAGDDRLFMGVSLGKPATVNAGVHFTTDCLGTVSYQASLAKQDVPAREVNTDYLQRIRKQLVDEEQGYGFHVDTLAGVNDYVYNKARMRKALRG